MSTSSTLFPPDCKTAADRPVLADSGRQVSLFLRRSPTRTRPLSSRWFQEAEAGMLECFQKSLDKFDSLGVETQTAEKHDGE